MKHLKTYALFESETELTKEQIQFLKKGTRKREKNWSLNSEGKVDVEGNFNCTRQGLTDFKGVKFGKVSGDFDCCYNSLISLEGAPETVGGVFYCSFNQLTTLKGAPKTVGGNFYCVENSLTTLEGAPKTVGGDFYCTKNPLMTLEGAPESVGGDFHCYGNSLTTLVGSPESVGGNFDCSRNSLTTLKGAPESVGRDFKCFFNSLISLEGVPETVGGVFYCDEFSVENWTQWTLDRKLQILKTGTPEAKILILTILTPEFLQQEIDKSPEEMTVALKSIWKELKKDPRYSTIKLPKDLEQEADLLSDLDVAGL